MSGRALVTGASGAFGTAVRAELKRRGWSVVGLDLEAGRRRGDRVRRDRRRRRAAGGGEAAQRLGGLDVLVNNAGIGGPASAGAPPDEHVRRMLDVNLLGAWRVTAAAIDHLVESRGRVVLIGSRMSFIGLPLGAAYGVSKRALTAYADALRAEYGTHVTVTCVHPAFVRTPIHDRTREAGLQLEGFSHRGAARAGRRHDRQGVRGRATPAATSRSRAAARSRWASRATCRALVDRVVARTLAKRIAAGELDEADIAAGLRTRHRRG